MRKRILFLPIFFSIILQVYGQDFSVAELVNKCISTLDKPVPNEFRQIDKQVFFHDGLLLLVHNELVIVSSIVNVFESDSEAQAYISLFSAFFKNSDWDFYRTSSMRAEIYSRNGLYVIIERPRRHENGSIETMIGFSRNLNVDEM
jgi:hypothetical protein